MILNYLFALISIKSLVIICDSQCNNGLDTSLYTHYCFVVFFSQKTPGNEWLDYIHQPHRVDIYYYTEIYLTLIVLNYSGDGILSSKR